MLGLLKSLQATWSSLQWLCLVLQVSVLEDDKHVTYQPSCPPVVCESRLVSPGKQCKLYQVVKSCNREFFQPAAKQNIDTGRV